MKHLFIVNPVAGGHDRSGEIRALVEKTFADRGEDWEVYVTKAPMDACDKIRDEAADGRELRVYACGGDGTLNECVNGAANLPHVAVTCLPGGTGNDFIKIFGGEQAGFFNLETLLEGVVHPLDLIRCNNRYSLNICSVGIDARVGADVHTYSKLPLVKGPLAYVVSMVVNVFRGINQRLRIACGDKVFEGLFALVCACNGRYYGGGFNPIRTALPDNGVLEFLVVKEVPLWKLPLLLGRYARGDYEKLPDYVTHLTDTSMHIESPEELVINVDGEVLWGKTVDLEVVPGALMFITPSQLQFFESQMEKMEEIR